MAFSVTCIHVTHGRYNHIEGATIKDGSPFEYTSRTDKQPIHIDQRKRAGGGGVKTKSLPSFRTHESDKSIVGVYNIYYVTCYISPESNTC